MADLDDPNRLNHFHGAVADLGPDAVLDGCVRKASEVTGAPISIITFVMGHVQLFRTHVGLPPELDISRATSRCESFCQFVVREEAPFLVSDVPNDPRVPQSLASTYGIRSYLGVPVSCAGQVLGSLCVVDVKPRDWKEEEVKALKSLAESASARLNVLASARSSKALPEFSYETAKALVSELGTSARAVERALIEVGPMVRLAAGVGKIDGDALQRSAGALKEAIEFYGDMRRAVAELCETGDRLGLVLSALEAKQASGGAAATTR
jgi:hypothetical protein